MRYVFTKIEDDNLPGAFNMSLETDEGEALQGNDLPQVSTVIIDGIDILSGMLMAQDLTDSAGFVSHAVRAAIMVEIQEKKRQIAEMN